MDPQAVTIASGIILLIVFALVGWYVRRHLSSRGPSEESRRKMKK